MTKRIPLLKALKSKFPKILSVAKSRLNEDICRYLNFFIDDNELLITSLVQNPYGRNEHLEVIKKKLGDKVYSHLLILNRLHQGDARIIGQYHRYTPDIILFLLTFKVIFDHHTKKEIEKLYPTKIIRFAMQLLEKNDITEIRLALEDHFFELIEPKVYHNYQSLLKFTRKSATQKQKEIVKKFHSMLDEQTIEGVIEVRLKTNYSIHNKILKKNILFSQILDTIGIRIIVGDEEDCYKTMASILKNYPIMTSRIKDYIAVPKENGYQSIHLTIFYDNYPVEIQIRTFEMHEQAQYGRASHATYKKHG